MYLINRTPSKVINFSTPLECLFGDVPDYSSLRTFGCACWPNLRPYNARKLEFLSKCCAFMVIVTFIKATGALISLQGECISLAMLFLMNKFFPSHNYTQMVELDYALRLTFSHQILFPLYLWAHHCIVQIRLIVPLIRIQIWLRGVILFRMASVRIPDSIRST